MSLVHLAVQSAIAIACSCVASILIPRQLPGRWVSLVLIGFVGVLLGEWGFRMLNQQFGVTSSVLTWQFQGVQIVPAILGSAAIIYVITLLLQWVRYYDR
ncbi:hypothetical protein DO97_03970 [Neosynechococcus sphagnicola sy1]|uniref:Uncharacterized protein n=1 Tax=Neosynechococcus sphagnicola sy1 TaxID=1497020 RepID=A0A098TKR6_9CYAN|nr:hypothetical protein [Neosynechococcus sphagnicola]KGF72876.1 hypothetical protein DO97_03970 [Neosynechococcus sphagnicola sy1]